MKALSIREAREQLTKIEQLVAREGEILVTRRGRPVARIVPLTGQRRLPSRAGLRSKMALLAPSESLVRAERDER